MNRTLEFRKIATTEDTGDPVLEAKFPDTGSFLHAIITDDKSVVRVWLVESHVKGDMKKMLDEITKQLGTEDVWFLEPDLGKLEDILDDYERVEKMVESPNGKEKSVRLKCKWDRDR